jgi:hypothetical protein
MKSFAMYLTTTRPFSRQVRITSSQNELHFWIEESIGVQS